MEWPANNTYPEVRNWLEQFLNDDARERSAIVRTLLEWYTGKSRTMLLAEPHRFSESDLNRLKAFGSELQSGKPVQYITGEAWFYGRCFLVNSSVLIPRPETEELVSACLEIITPEARVLDIGTGSGCIATTLALEAPKTQVTAWDISKEALAVARSNAQRLHAQVNFEQRDALVDHSAGPFDLIVSNPPYIPAGEAEKMSRRVTAFEPHVALFVDHDPLLFYSKIIDQLTHWLKPGGHFAFECHEDYADDVLLYCLTAGCQASLRLDAQNKARMVIGQLKP